MKLILTQEVDGLGAPGDVVEVKDGYGRNYLVPRGLGHRAGPAAARRPSSRSRRRAPPARCATRTTPTQIKAKLESSPVNVKVRAGDGRPPVRCRHRRRDRRRAQPRPPASRSTSARSWSTNPIKSLGAHQVTVKLHDEVSATVALNVVPA